MKVVLVFLNEIMVGIVFVLMVLKEFGFGLGMVFLFIILLRLVVL